MSDAKSNANEAEWLYPFDRTWSIPDAVYLACILEATAPKAGNVHPSASFPDMTFSHFVLSALAVRDSLIDNASKGVGEIVLAAIRGTRNVARCNTNLGSVLLFAPIVRASFDVRSDGWQERIRRVLLGLNSKDSRLVYEAICTARPGGMGKRETSDIAGTPPDDLVAAMTQVSDVDAVARQYTSGFACLFERLLPWLDQELLRAKGLNDAICRLQVRWLAQEKDGLIVRKVGDDVASQIQEMAQAVFTESQVSEHPVFELPSYRGLDRFLRADGNRRNPGTTADLIATALLLKLLQSSVR